MLRFLGWRNLGSECLPSLVILKQADQRPVQMLNREHFQNFNAIRHYLLDQTQHMIGGFGKLPGDAPGPYLSPPSPECLSNVVFRPDILHSSLGLAALAAMHDPDLKSIDPTLCISISAREYIEQSFSPEQGRSHLYSPNIVNNVH